jgi:predicted nucleic acid-binding protein
VIFDTDFLIAYDKGTKRLSKTAARAFIDDLDDLEPLLISRVTWMEFMAGFPQQTSADRKISRFTVLEFDGDLWWIASRIKRDLSRRGLGIGTPDCMIAATAITYGQRLVTLNQTHFSRIAGLAIVAPE